MCAEPTGGILDFCSIYNLFWNFLSGNYLVPRILPEGFVDWLAFGLAGFTLAFIVINAIVMAGAIYTWFERRALGRFQARLGPNRWGPFGLFQPFADIGKLLTKEDVVPDTADRPVATLAPIVFVVPAFLVFAVPVGVIIWLLLRQKRGGRAAPGTPDEDPG